MQGLSRQQDSICGAEPYPERIKLSTLLPKLYFLMHRFVSEKDFIIFPCEKEYILFLLLTKIIILLEKFFNQFRKI